MDQLHHFHSNDDALLPPGFRFHPTDEELITYYLLKKVLDGSFACRAIAEVDLNKCEPWRLPEKAKMGEKEWYFFSLRDRKYPTGLRTNRATEAGYWKATGKDREILSSKTCSLVGMKKTLVFYRGRAPKGEKSNWVMHEYRLEGKFAYHFISRSSKDEWVISRVFQKSGMSCGRGGASCSGGGGGGVKKARPYPSMCSVSLGHVYQDVSSPSLVPLPPLLDSSPFAPASGSAVTVAALPGHDNPLFDSSYPVSKEHVSCFSTAAPLSTIPPSDFGIGSSTFSFSSPITIFKGLESSFSEAAPSPISGFPSLRSLQENLHLPYSFGGSLPAPPSDINMGCEVAPSWSCSNESWAVTVPDEHKATERDTGNFLVGGSELDLVWRS
ncbi:hypothetical protein MLD38_000487 [Melastoma candidum]|uniref:Uncharacterized protein n=1 Tax=Melastoma candidum TaxID=119954 RepID=A0ACB9SE68_9MYRT|nr:hypothetical protein MLD38_000487 [Melastoma candidum]